MTPQEFIDTYTGKPIDYDGSYGFQCFDVANQYIKDITGVKPLMTLLNASDIYKRPEGIIPPGVVYERIENTPEAIPQQGDIIVWESKSWNGGYGHVAIVQTAGLENFTALYQDGILATEPAKIGTYNYINVLGWLRVGKSPATEIPRVIDTLDTGDYYDWEVDTQDAGINCMLLRAGQYHGILDHYDYTSEAAWQHCADINGYATWQELDTKIANSGGYILHVWEKPVKAAEPAEEIPLPPTPLPPPEVAVVPPPVPLTPPAPPETPILVAVIPPPDVVITPTAPVVTSTVEPTPAPETLPVSPLPAPVEIPVSSVVVPISINSTVMPNPPNLHDTLEATKQPLQLLSERWDLRKRLIGLSKYNIDVASVGMAGIALLQYTVVFHPAYKEAIEYICWLMGVLTGVPVIGASVQQAVKGVVRR
jgi:hypothetical protein